MLSEPAIKRASRKIVAFANAPSNKDMNKTDYIDRFLLTNPANPDIQIIEKWLSSNEE